MSTVELRSIKKAYGAVSVIEQIDLSVEDGELLALVGPSGCGKSTLLRMIAGLEQVTQGDVLIDGQVVNGKSPKERNVAMVFQNYALYPHMTVRENINLNMRIAGIDKAEIARRVDQAAELLDIKPLLDRRPAQLSGGQRQRVAMGRAIVRNPSVFLFDEPLSNLDAKLRVQMRGEIKALHEAVGTTSIYVTHDQIEAMTLADRVVVMNDGHIEQGGGPIDLYGRPANRFVAGFIGSPSMNLTTARVIRTDGGAVAQLADAVQLTLPDNDLADTDASVTLGIRPEHIDIVAPTEGIQTRVRHVEPTGAMTFLDVQLDDEVSLTVAASGERQYSAGERLSIRMAPNRIHLFDVNSGTRLNKD